MDELNNTEEFDVHSESDDVGLLYYQACNALEARFNSTGKFRVTIVFTPDDES